MSTPFIGNIKLFAGDFAITGWALCNGQLLSIAQYTALFTLIGTTYGGDGVNTFGLPDLRGRIPLGMGTGPGLSPYVEGQFSGTENVTLITSQIPSHAHSLMASSANATTNVPTAAALASNPAPTGQAVDTFYLNAPSAPAVRPLNAANVAATGGNQPHTNVMPYLGINYLIALEGIFPSQN